MYGVLQTEGVESLAMEHPAPAAGAHANYYSRTPPSPRGACLQYSAVHHSAPSICTPAQPPPASVYDDSNNCELLENSSFRARTP